MKENLYNHLAQETTALKEVGLYKEERIILSSQDSHIEVNHSDVINLCSNNYLGLCNNKKVIDRAKNNLDRYGLGMSSVRFICGTQNIHKELEKNISDFLQTEDTILYSSCFDANTGLFETILGPEDTIISDELNHASIIDGIRLCKSKRLRYQNNNMLDLKVKLDKAQGSRYILIATDGVFSMDGTIADLKSICDLADKYSALVMVDDSHAVGVLGSGGRGSHEHSHVIGRVDLITGTLGKALGGASGGYTSGKKEIIDWLRQRSRPYLFSNTLAPVICSTSNYILDTLKKDTKILDKLKSNTDFFRLSLSKLGFNIIDGIHPIIPIILGDAILANQMASELLKEGVYVIGFSFPVVPKGKARIRTQISAAHSRSDLEKALSAFELVGKKLKII